MTNRWGNDQHGPGGDPSWLGGGDRSSGGAGERGQSAGDFSSDFRSDFTQDQRHSQDFHRPAESDLPERDRVQGAESMAPRFGDATGEAANAEGRDQDSPWMSNFTGAPSEGSSRGARGTIGRVIAMLVPFLGVAFFAIIAMRAMGHNISMLWIIVLFGLPLIRRVIRLVKKNLGD